MLRFFRKKTALDVIDSYSIAMYKKFTDGNLTDYELLEVVQTTMRAFRQASDAKDEHISGLMLMNISAFMVMFRAQKDKDEWLSHLNSEVEFYLDSGLRTSYMKSNLVGHI